MRVSRSVHIIADEKKYTAVGYTYHDSLEYLIQNMTGEFAESFIKYKRRDTYGVLEMLLPSECYQSYVIIHGGLSGLTGISKDITEMRGMSEKLRESLFRQRGELEYLGSIKSPEPESEPMAVTMPETPMDPIMVDHAPPSTVQAQEPVATPPAPIEPYVVMAFGCKPRTPNFAEIALSHVGPGKPAAVTNYAIKDGVVSISLQGQLSAVSQLAMILANS